MKLMKQRQRTTAALVGAAAALVAASACARVQGPQPNGLGVFLAAAEKTQAAKTVQLDMITEIKGGPPGQPSKTTGSGAMDFARRRMRMSFGSSYEMRLIGTTFYMKFSFSGDLSGGKPWIKFDTEAMKERIGVDLAEILEGPFGGNPFDAMSFLEGAKSVQASGAEEIDGTATTRYEAVIDLRKTLGKIPEEYREMAEKEFERTGFTELPLTAWIDGNGLVRRIRSVYDTTKARSAKDRQGVGTVTFTFHDFGKPVTIEPPPASETADALELKTRTNNP